MLPCNANHELARDAPNTIPVECPDPCAAPVDPYRLAIADPMEGGKQNSIGHVTILKSVEYLSKPVLQTLAPPRPEVVVLGVGAAQPLHA